MTVSGSSCETGDSTGGHGRLTAGPGASPPILETACRLSMLNENDLLAEVGSTDWGAGGVGDWRYQVCNPVRQLWGSLGIEAKLAVFTLSLQAAQEIAESDRTS